MDDEKLARVMGGALVTMGVLHFAAPKPFDTLIPEELPGDPRLYTYGSGLAEIGIGAGLLAPRTRRTAAGLATGLFVGVFPANVNMVRLWADKPPVWRAIAWARLPLQIPMITAAVRLRRRTR